MRSEDEHWMQHAIALARYSATLDEVPVGAVVVLDQAIIGRGHNQPITLNDPSAHAEVMAIRDACIEMDNYRLPNATLYVTLEPCLMCVGTIVHARIKRVVFSAREPKAGAVCSRCAGFELEHLNHRVEWSEGACAGESATLLSEFFKTKRRRARST